MILIYIYIFIIGLSMGSFINVLIARLDKKGGILTGRSECPNCHTQLSWLDLIPVVSYIFLMGKCRYCKIKISAVYPIIELTTASFILAYFVFNGLSLGIEAYYHVVLISMLISLAFFDYLYYILPDKINFSLILIALVYNILFSQPELINLFTSSFLFAGSFAIIYLVTSGRGMGFGDVKLVLAIGLILGYPLGLFSIILAIWSAAICGIALILFKKANLKTALPLGSFLSVSTLFFIIFERIIAGYLNVYGYFL